MKRLIALLLIAVILFSSLTVLTSCTEDLPEDNDKSDASTPDENTPEDKEKEDQDEKIEVPDYRDHARGTVNFSEIVYARPDIDKTIGDFKKAAEIIEKNSDEYTYRAQLDKIISLEDGYNDFLTMHAYANIKLSEDASDEYWAEEYEYLSTKYPELAKVIEDLFVAAAKSPHAESFEDDYFGEGLIEEYKDGGVYTDELVSLLEKEAELEAEYSSLSTSNVIISFESMTDTLDNILSHYADIHGEDSQYYSSIKESCLELYENALSERNRAIFVELIKTRRLIADEYEYDSYATLAYEQIYHDYSEEDLLRFIDDISKFIVPIYYNLSFSVFLPYFYSYNSTDEIGANELVNDFGEIIGSIDSDFYDIYSYMIQHELYNCKKAVENRFEGSFATYLDSYNAPFLFATFGGTSEDLMTLSHEFGHFIDSYINYGQSTSLDLMEVSSTALEFLALSHLEKTVTEEDYKYLTYLELESAMQTLIYQGFYALFEHYIYDVPYEEITEERLTEIADIAAEDMGIYLRDISLDHMIIPHTVLYPFYVQSYCTSTAVALDIYYSELSEEGAGIEAYKELITRENSTLKFEEYLWGAEISSPLSQSFLKELANKIHFQVIGSNYFTDYNDNTVI